MAKKVDYPFHLGMTATGPLIPGLIKSSLGIGILLIEGIGDTIRVSLTGSPVDEVKAGYEILKALGLVNGIEIISCPACGRCKVNLFKIVKDFEQFLNLHFTPIRPDLKVPDSHHNFKVAIMGCEVNGPGEAKEADVGIAFSGKHALLFKKGSPLRKVSERTAFKILIEELKNLVAET